MAYIIIRHPDNKTDEIKLSNDKSLSLGRAPVNDVCLNRDPKISGKHCVLSFDQASGRHLITDLGSTNGTIINLSRIAKSAVLRDNDKIRIGDIRILFRDGDPTEATSTTTTRKVKKIAISQAPTTDTCVIPTLANLKQAPRLTLVDNFHYEPGQLIERYEIISKIADFRFGSIYSVRLPGKTQRLALKIFNRAFDIHHPGIDEFTNIINKLRTIENPYFVKITDSGVFRGHCFYTMEMVHAESLDKKLAAGHPLSEPEASSIVYTISLALNDAYNSYGIIHGHISPSEILIDNEDNLMILSYGMTSWIAKYFSDGRPVSLPWYMSPEQVSGHPAEWNSDMYSLGIIFFQMLTGVLPFYSENDKETLDMQLNSATPDPHRYNPNIALSDSIVELIWKMTEKNPASRFASWQDFRTAIESISVEYDSTTAQQKSRQNFKAVNKDEQVNSAFKNFFKN